MGTALTCRRVPEYSSIDDRPDKWETLPAFEVRKKSCKLPLWVELIGPVVFFEARYGHHETIKE